MTEVEDFGKNLYAILANEFINEENLYSSEEKLDISGDKPDILEKNPRSAKEKYLDSIDDISRSVLMLSYAYRPAFIERFDEVNLILERAEGNPMIYVRCFAEVSHENYSPLKFLIVCSFISEIFLFTSKTVVLKKKHRYVQQTTEALKDVFQCIFEKDFPQNGWTDIQNEASKIAKGFKFLRLFMYNADTRSENDSQLAEGIIANRYKYVNDIQQTDVVMAGTHSQEMASVNSPSVSSSRVLERSPVIKAPIVSPDGLQTNQISHLYSSEILISKPVFPISFGTVDENKTIWYLLQDSSDQNEAVTFLNPDSGTRIKFQNVVETAEPSNIESHAQENSTARSSEDEPEPPFRAVKLTESGEREHSAADDQDFSEQDLRDVETQFMKYLYASGSDGELEPSFQTVKKTENFESEGYTADNAIISAQELIDVDDNDCRSKTLSKGNDPESEIFSKENICDPERAIFSKEENVNDPESETFSKEESDNDPESETFSKEGNVSDPESATFLKEENANDPDSQTFSKENTLTSGNAVNVPENQSETSCQIKSNDALQDFTTNEAVSSQKIDDQQATEIEINFQTDENNLSAKVLHLSLGGKKFIVRMPADMSLIFEYKGNTSSTKQSQT